MPLRQPVRAVPWPTFAAVLGATLLPGCGHTEPFSSPPPGTDLPFDPAEPVRLTLNAGGDRTASWLPDGSGILYSTQLIFRDDRDVCLALLPPTGGAQRELWCDVPGDRALTNVIQSPVAAPDGRLAFIAANSTVGGTNPSFEAIAVAPSLLPESAVNLRRIPYSTDQGSTHPAAGRLRWLGADRLAYLGQAVAYRFPCEICARDTITTGLAVATLDVGQPGSTPIVVPGTESASGVASSAEGDLLFYTLGGDSRVFRRALASGEVTVVHDFGSAGIARDVDVVGNRLVASVGGRVAFGPDADLGPTQRDSGGVVHVVDLDSGAAVALDDPLRLYRRPALSPAGDRIVAEGYELVIVRFVDPVTEQMFADTTVSRSSDLYLLGAP